MDIRQYYALTPVRHRMLEYMGLSDESPVTAVYLTRCDLINYQDVTPMPISSLDHLLERGSDMARSLWDKTALVAHLDIEYVNFDFADEPYLDPIRAFYLQEPIRKAMESVMETYHLHPLWLLSGRGYHVVWRIRYDTRAFSMLRRIGRIPDSLLAKYESLGREGGVPISRDIALAQAGLGMVMEHLARRIQLSAQPLTRIPLALTAQDMGPGERGREMISLDISEYGDPLHRRIVRIPFSAYRKPWETGRFRDARTLAQLPEMVMIPLLDQDVWQGLAIRRFYDEAAELARVTRTNIPDQSRETERLIRDYARSELARFHKTFYAVEPHPSEKWPETYDRFDPEALQGGPRQTLVNPNERMLQPSGIRELVERLMGLDWHPRHISGLIRSKYERDHGWNAEWLVYDAATRADFYTRLFAGLVSVPDDELAESDSDDLDDTAGGQAAPFRYRGPASHRGPSPEEKEL